MGKSNTTSLPLTLAFKPLSIWLPNSKTDVGGARLGRARRTCVLSHH
jgi:hypothetical protein